MPINTFGRTDLVVSRLGFGGANIGVLDTPIEDVTTMLNAMLDAGLTAIDTAALYGPSEERIGAAIGHRRDEFVLISKCGTENPQPDIDAPPFSEKQITLSIDRSLKRLKTAQIDVMFIHSCSLEKLQRGDAWNALMKAHQAGKVRYPGYSGDNDDVTWAVDNLPVHAIETSVSICDQANIKGVLPKAAAKGVGVVAKRPIANAAWRQPDEQTGFYAKYASVYHARLAKMGFTPADFGIAGDPARAWPELALRYTLSYPAVHSAIIGTTSLERAMMNIDIASAGPLPADVVTQIEAAFAKAESESGEPWEART